jgi:SpoVK/Ycf46/Vps4 family AAA+-type ATPase
MTTIKDYKRAAFPCVAVETHEEDRLLRHVLTEVKSGKGEEFPIYSISASGGLMDRRANGCIDKAANYSKAISFAASNPGIIMLIYDYQHIIRNAGAYRALKDAFGALKDIRSMIVLVAPIWSLPAELQHDVPILQFDLPTREQLSQALHVVADSAAIKLNGDTDNLLDAASGLTLQEAENSFALSLIKDKKLIPATVESEKMKLIKNSGYLEVYQPIPESELGGLDNLKDYIKLSIIPAMHDDQLRVKGILLMGVPGSGKSCAAKVLGSLMHYPVVRMDISAMKGSLVGQSEANIRNALKLIDAIAPAVCWIDEIEKAVGGHASSAQSDGGTTLGMLGTLLTWLQEHKSPVICIMTCNDYAKLPAELTRAGRVDQRFFVDLPSAGERLEIAAVHLKRFGAEYNPEICAHIVTLSKDWTGAEIEQLIKESARATMRKITKESLTKSALNIRPISKVKEEEITRMRDYAKGNFVIANSQDTKTEIRNLDI